MKVRWKLKNQNIRLCFVEEKNFSGSNGFASSLLKTSLLSLPPPWRPLSSSLTHFLLLSPSLCLSLFGPASSFFQQPVYSIFFLIFCDDPTNFFSSFFDVFDRWWSCREKNGPKKSVSNEKKVENGFLSWQRRRRRRRWQRRRRRRRRRPTPPKGVRTSTPTTPIQVMELQALFNHLNKNKNNLFSTATTTTTAAAAAGFCNFLCGRFFFGSIEMKVERKQQQPFFLLRR